MKKNMYTNARTFFAGLAVLAASQSFAQFTWGPAGPIYTSGRARNMVVDRASSNTLYVGSASGGVFKSIDAGANWLPLDDQGSVRNISYMSQATDGTIFVGTGEGFLRFGQKAKAPVGTGLYKLSGNTMVQVAPAAITGSVINRIACNPNDANKLALATEKGIMISTDGGQTFFKANITPTLNANHVGMDVKFDAAGVLYCSIGNERGGSIALDAVDSKVYKSSDASLNVFSNITPTSSVVSDAKYGRIELAISPSAPNVVYASCANKNTTTTLVAQPGSATMKALFVSTDGGTNWQLIAQGASQLDPLSNGGSVATGDYAHVLVVNPGDPYMLFVGGYGAYIYFGSSSNVTGGTWAQIGSRFAINSPYYLHENIHDIKIVPGTPNRFYFITDAGIYRSTDLVSPNQLPSFQAIYKGFVTGQFNSVSIERFPGIVGTPVDPNNLGRVVEPNFGYVGGTGGNGLVYYSGTSSLVTREANYIGGEVYNAEFSKLLPDAAFFTIGSGGMYRTSNARTAQPQLLKVNNYSGALSQISGSTQDFANSIQSTGTPFRLWENYGQAVSDSVYFYNDTVITPYAFTGGVSQLTTQATFTFSAPRETKFAQLDSIVIRTGTASLPSPPERVPEPFAPAQDNITIKLANVVVPTTTILVSTSTGTKTQTVQVYEGTNLIVTGPADLISKKPKITINHSTLLDEISITFTAPPFLAKTTPSYQLIADPAVYYRVWATSFYKYDIGDTVRVSDNSITTRTATYTTRLTRALSWQYGDSASAAPIGTVVPFSKSNKPVAIPVSRSARIAISLNATASGGQPAVVVSKAPLNLNDAMNFVRVAQSGAFTDSSNGDPTFNQLFYPGRPVLLEWSKSGTELYFATHDNKLYRVSHITRIMDLSPSSYDGKFTTDVFKYVSAVNQAIPNRDSPYRTTQIASFSKPITSLAVSNDGSKLLVTLNGAITTGTSTGTTYMNTVDVRKADVTNQTWVTKDNGSTELVGKTVYCSLMEKDDDKKVFLGTDVGLLYTSDITAAGVNWVLANNNQLPRVQVFDIDQQTMTPADSYNSGEIYVATNGRGIWSSRSFFKPYTVGVEEQEQKITTENRLTMFPNPTSGKLNIVFDAVDGERAAIQVFDLSGRQVATEDLGMLSGGENRHSFDSHGLSSGIYILNISSDSGLRRVSKLVVAK